MTEEVEANVSDKLPTSENEDRNLFMDSMSDDKPVTSVVEEEDKCDKAVKNAAKKLYKTVRIRTGSSDGEQILLKNTIIKVMEDVIPVENKNQGMATRLAKKIERKHASTEDNFVKVVEDLLKPTTPLDLEIDDEKYESAPFKDKILKFPLKTAQVVGTRVLESAAMNGTAWLRSFLPYRQIQVLTAFCIYSLISLDAILFTIPLVAFYASFTAMIITTLQMIYGKRKIQDVLNWAKLLQQFDSEIDTGKEEEKTTFKLITPYLWSYFASLLIAVFSFSLADKSYIPCAESFVFSMVLALVTFWTLSDKYNILIVISILLNFFVTCAKLFNNFPKIPFVYHLVALATKPLLQIRIVPGFHLCISLPALAYVLIPAAFLAIAQQNSGKGLNKLLLPHLICLSWWHIAIMYFSYSTWLGVFRATVGYTCAILLFPVMGVLVLGFICFYVLKFFAWGSLLKIFTTLALIALPAFTSIWLQSTRGLKVFREKRKPLLVSLFLASLALLSALSSVYIKPTLDVDSKANELSWSDYDSYCGFEALQKSNMADLQMRCSHLERVPVKWSGTVLQVRIGSVENGVKSFLDMLPFILADQLKCIYGEAYATFIATKLDDNGDEENNDEDKVKKTLENHEHNYVKYYKSKCHVKKYDYYNFQIDVHMLSKTGSFQKIIINAAHKYKRHLLKLKTGDNVTFNAKLERDLGHFWPKLKLKYITCDSCMEKLVSTKTMDNDDNDDDDDDEEEQSESSLLHKIIEGFGFLINFFTFPLINFELE